MLGIDICKERKGLPEDRRNTRPFFFGESCSTHDRPQGVASRRPVPNFGVGYSTLERLERRHLPAAATV
jgi:hypothetical protein